MEEFESLSRGWDHLGNIERTLGDLQGSRTAICELIQNADDALGATRMRFVVTGAALEVWNDGIFDRCSDVTSTDCEWLESRQHRCDFHSFRKMASGDKRNRPGTTGAFGVGFTAVYQFTDRPELISNGEHWIIDEMAAEQHRIQRSRTPIDVEGTTFRLPWATIRSTFRQRVRQEPMAPAAIGSFINELRAAIPAAMPFLKKVRSIEAVNGLQHVTYKRTTSPGRIAVVSSDGLCYEWFVLTGDFAEQAATLKEMHAGMIEEARSPEVRVAVPLGDDAASGLLYATLPTEEPSHLPLLVHADFVPASDRKRIRFDTSPVSEWNRAAIRAAARLLAGNLEAVAAAIGDVAFVNLLLSVSALHKRLESERIEPVFAAFWEETASALPRNCVVPIATGGHGTVESVRLWAEDAEIAAADVLHDLGVELVASPVRAEWFRIRGDTPIRVLSLGDLALALHAAGLTQRWTPSDRTDALSADAGLKALWALLDVLLDRRDRSTQEARDLLKACAVAPGWDGAIWPVTHLYHVDQATQDLLADVGVRATFLDLDRFGTTGLRLAQMVDAGNPALVLTWVDEAFHENASDIDESTRLKLLRWFFKRWAELDEEGGTRLLAQLPIFPTAAGPSSLVGLALPGDFNDELGLARLIAIDGIEEMRPFLGKLGAQRLTFARYCTDFVVDAVASGELDETHRRRLLSLLAVRLSEVQDNDDVGAALRPLDLVPCTDGKWRPGDDVYLTRAVRSIVGDDVHFAAIPGERSTAHEDLYRWLGGADQPRPRDVEARCNELRSGPTGHRPMAEAIIDFVGHQFATKRNWAEAHHARLRTIPWLPAEGDHGRGHAPQAVYTMFQRTLFASQARFLNVSVTVQRGNAAFLEWLGVRTVPTPKQVVDHLLWSAERNEPVRDDIWIYLNQNANDPALDALRGKRCLLIAETKTYVKPSEVYWQWHPFGRFRHQLGPKFAEYQALLNRLDVAQKPRPTDALEVLQDVAARHGGEPAPLLEGDVQVVQACWRMLSAWLDDETLAADELGTLATAEVVLDSRRWLRTPRDVYFRDSPSLADRFGPAVHERLIDRPEGLWRALSAAGVRNLSDAVDSRIVEQYPAGPGGVFAARLATRRRLLLRVLAAEDHEAMSKLESFDENIELQHLSRLVIQQALSADDQLHVSEAYQRGALYLPEQQTYLYVETGDVIPAWVEIARELSRALGVDGDYASGVAAAIKGLLEAETDDAARAELDELGFRALDEAIVQDAEPNVADDLGGTPAELVDHVGHVDTNDAHDDRAAEQSAGAVGAGEPVDGGDSDLSGGRETNTSKPGPGNAGDGYAPQGDGRRMGDGTSTSVPSGLGEEGSGAGAGRAQGSRAASLQSRLRSYVAPVRDEPVASDGGSDGDGDSEVERAGVDAVLDFERVHGREPEEMPPNNPGFDIRSVDTDGAVRVIEVKATADEWGSRGVAISSTQFATAQQRREEFWLYIVDRALEAPRVHPINDPATKIDQYFFDDGWQAVTEAAEEPASPLPSLLLAMSPTGVTGAVPFIDLADAREASPSGWVTCQERNRQDSWFAVRIRGDALGMAYRGGLAYVEPLDRDVEDDELVLVVLDEQVDPDAGSAVTIRRWRPERDLTDNQLALRLWSDGSVEPLTVHHPDAVDVLGLVRGTLRLSDLESMGYC